MHEPARCLVLMPELDAIRAALATVLPFAAEALPEVAAARLHVDLPADGSALLLVEAEASRRPAASVLDLVARRLLACHGSLRGVEVVAAGPSGGRAVASAGDAHVAFARGTLAAPTSLPGRLSPGGFAQASREGAALLASTVVAALDEACGTLAGRDVLELFAGSGALTLSIAARGARVAAVESDPRAAANLEHAAAEAGLPVSVTCGDAARATTRFARGGRVFDAAVLDPPRTGAAAAVRALPGVHASAIVHVSCDAPTFARDAATLLAGGLALRHVRPLLLFPQTAHFETVALFTPR